MTTLSTSPEQAGAQAPAEAPQLNTYRCRFAQTMFTIIEVKAADEDAARELASDIYESEATPPADYYGDYEIDVVTQLPPQGGAS